MEGLLCSKSLPPGFRFHPTDEELFMYYLKRKVSRKRIKPEMIAEVDVYRFAPWELPPIASLKTKDLVWYFFCPRARKYTNGGRANRATEVGYWKSTGNDRTVMYKNRPVGKIKTLIFHRGKAPKGMRTDWVMHEYRLEDKVLADKGVCQESFVICKIYEKRGLGPRNGEHYGARFVEEEWDDDDDDDDDDNEREGVPEVVPNTGPRCIADSPDGQNSALTNVAPTPIVVDPRCAGGSSDGFVSTLNNDVIAPNTAFAVDLDYPAHLGIVDTPSTSGFSGTPFAATSVGAQNVTATVAEDMDDDEMERLLANFTEKDDDIFGGLGDLSDFSGHYDFGWGDHFSLDDLQ